MITKRESVSTRTPLVWFFIFMAFVVLGGDWSFFSDVVAAPELPDLEHARWLILGPFPNDSTPGEECPGFSRDYLSSAGGEAAIRPKSGSKINAKIWSPYDPKQGIINFQTVFGSVENCVAYAYTEFSSPVKRQAALKIGSDDGLKVWLNGETVWENHIHRSYLHDNDSVVANLSAGLNRLLVKIDQGNGGWEFGARFMPLNAEETGWRKTKQRKWQFALTHGEFSKTSVITGRAVTVPSFAVKMKVEVTVTDPTGYILTRQPAETGQLVNLSIPAGFTGPCAIRVSGPLSPQLGTDRETIISSNPVVVLVGDSRKIIRDAIKKARKVASRLADTRRGEDPAPTLQFLADQLEGKLHPSLMNTERNIRAVRTIDEICHHVQARLGKSALFGVSGKEMKPDKIVLKPETWPNGMLTGIRQWAYRSGIDGSSQPYSLYLPENYQPLKKYRLLVCLHGYSGDDYSAVKQAVDGAFPDDFIVVAPFGRGDLAYRSVGEQDVLDVMELVMRSYPIDPNQVYLTGWSMGGCGAWRMGQFYADRFAAVAPFCGWTGRDFLENLQNTPFLIVHGDNDQTVPVAYDQAASDRLSDMKYPVRYDELPGVGHDAWGTWIRGFGADRLFEYFRKYRRNPWPEKVTVAAAHLRYGKEYWIRILELLKPLTKGSVSVAIRDNRHVRVSTDNVKTFVLNLKHPKLAQNGRVLLEIDGYGLPVDAGRESCLIDYSRDDERFVCRKSTNASTITPEIRNELARHDGGGLADLFTGPLTIVYGTAFDAAHQKKLAEILADWRTTPHAFAGTKVGKFPIMQDKDVTLADMRRSNLLLIGNNRVFSRLLTPLSVKSRVDYLNGNVFIRGKRFENTGLMMVYPNPEVPSRLIGVINLPFDDRQTTEIVLGLQSALRLYGLRGDDTPSFVTPDVMVLKSPTQIMWQGEFDYQWRNLRVIDYNIK